METIQFKPSLVRVKLYTVIILLLILKSAFGQGANFAAGGSMAVMGIDVQGIEISKSTLRNMVILSAEKTGKFSILDRYDTDDLLVKENIALDGCYGKSCLVNVGKLLEVERVLTGNVEILGNEIIMSFRLINVSEDIIEHVAVREFVNLPDEVHKMIEITINELFGLPNDDNLVNLLVENNLPISSPKTMLKLNGPRMGASVMFGPGADRLQAPKGEGGYEMFPVVTQFGYQFETQYLSAGTFQALIEYIGMVGGLESGKFIPSIAVMNGFRSSANGWEIAFGPVFKMVRTASGYYDEQGDWNLEWDWDYENGDNPYEIIELPDSRGDLRLSTNLILAIGKTFKSGYLNIPVNVYVIPNKKGTIVGTSVGFNISRNYKR